MEGRPFSDVLEIDVHWVWDSSRSSDVDDWYWAFDPDQRPLLDSLGQQVAKSVRNPHIGTGNIGPAETPPQTAPIDLEAVMPEAEPFDADAVWARVLDDVQAMPRTKVTRRQWNVKRALPGVYGFVGGVIGAIVVHLI